MTTLAIAVGLLLVAFTVLQTIFGLGFWSVLRYRRYRPLSDEQCPRVTLILCLRGADPFLEDTLQAMLALDYPRFDVRVVVDSAHDPALDVARGSIASHTATNVSIEVLENHRDDCGLKCSSLLQAIQRLDASCEVVALLDADTVPHRQWLRELVAPLADRRVGVAAGNRWYMPEQATWGDLVRYLWNASAVVQMYWSNFTWGGSLAIRTEVLRQTDLLDRWSKAFCEDTAIYAAVRDHGFRVAFVPTLMMINRESCTLGDFFPWMRRQLLNGRLYHPAWPLIATHGAVSTLAIVAAFLLLVISLVTANWQAAAYLGGAILLLQASNVLLLALTEHAVRRIVRARGEDPTWMSAGIIARLTLAIPLTQAIYAAALVLLVNMRRVQWRGVTYDIAGAWNVRLLDYQPYRPSASAADTRSL